MSLDHQNATATLTIDGLAICCFNKREQRWEVGYLRHDKHELKLALNMGESWMSIAIPYDARVIRIETKNPEKPDYEKDFPLGFFDGGPVPNRRVDWKRLPTDEQENFRWAINLDEGADVPHGTIKLKRPGYKVTMAYISDALLYTTKVSEPDLFLLQRKDDPERMSDAAVDEHIYGKTSDRIGADIKCAADGLVRITIDDEEVAVLNHRDGQPWSISLMNMAPDLPMAAMAGRYVKGDFQLYYDAFDATGDQYSLWARVPPDELGRTDCNISWVGGDNLDGMIKG